MPLKQTPVVDSWRVTAGSAPQMGSMFCLEKGLGGIPDLVQIPSSILGIKDNVVIK